MRDIQRKYRVRSIVGMNIKEILNYWGAGLKSEIKVQSSKENKVEWRTWDKHALNIRVVEKFCNFGTKHRKTRLKKKTLHHIVMEFAR